MIDPTEYIADVRRSGRRVDDYGDDAMRARKAAARERKDRWLAEFRRAERERAERYRRCKRDGGHEFENGCCAGCGMGQRFA